jgi:hypothetical protein
MPVEEEAGSILLSRYTVTRNYISLVLLLKRIFNMIHAITKKIFISLLIISVIDA